MIKRKKYILTLVIIALLASAFISSTSIIRLYWRARSDNPVRKGIRLAEKTGCFACHGYMGTSGIPDPGREGLEVPQWAGGMWMMYVESDQEIEEFILDGISKKRAKSKSAEKERRVAAVHMPAFRDILNADELRSLVAAFKVLSAMSKPPKGSLERKGLDIARSLKCFSCHGPAGSGGLPNPRSFTGFIPGWYGADFRDLVRSRKEFEEWIREGKIKRLTENPIARYFMRRQKVKMPAYASMEKRDIDALWAYSRWLEERGTASAKEE